MSRILIEDHSGLNYSTIARHLGIKQNTIMVMRCQQPVKFAYIKSLDPYFIKAFKQYTALQEDTVKALQLMYYELEDEMELTKFSTYLYKNGIYGSTQSWANSARKYYFRFEAIKGMHHKALLKRLEVLEAYKGFKNES